MHKYKCESLPAAQRALLFTLPHLSSLHHSVSWSSYIYPLCSSAVSCSSSASVFPLTSPFPLPYPILSYILLSHSVIHRLPTFLLHLTWYIYIVHFLQWCTDTACPPSTGINIRVPGEVLLRQVDVPEPYGMYPTCLSIHSSSASPSTLLF